MSLWIMSSLCVHYVASLSAHREQQYVCYYTIDNSFKSRKLVYYTRTASPDITKI